jgi:hypothetical protein
MLLLRVRPRRAPKDEHCHSFDETRASLPWPCLTLAPRTSCVWTRQLAYLDTPDNVYSPDPDGHSRNFLWTVERLRISESLRAQTVPQQSMPQAEGNGIELA